MLLVLRPPLDHRGRDSQGSQGSWSCNLALSLPWLEVLAHQLCLDSPRHLGSPSWRAPKCALPRKSVGPRHLDSSAAYLVTRARPKIKAHRRKPPKADLLLVRARHSLVLLCRMDK